MRSFWNQQGMSMNKLTQLSRLGLFDSQVPRYTSYPTAPQFSAKVGGQQMARWIGEIPEGGEISLYVHVPFCRRLCWFCACRTQGTQKLDTVRVYLETLKSEIALVKRHLPAGVRLSRLHWGGGTPTMMAPDMIRDLAATLADLAPLSETGEFSVEIDPNEIDGPRLDALTEAGMNRASIGVQDFDPSIQAAIGREQSFEITQQVAEALRERGIDSLNADILYGLPHQTPERITTSVQKLLALNPDRVALYGYAHVPWMARRQAMIPSESLPTPEQRLQLFETARRLFLWDGYAEIGIDHFAQPKDGLAVAAQDGTLRRNFQGYTNDTAPVLIGLGASSISRFPEGYAQNAGSTGEYTKLIRAGGFATTRGHRFGGEDLLRGRMIEALMCYFKIDIHKMEQEFGNCQAEIWVLLRDLEDRFGEFVEATPEGFWILPEGRPLTRMIARALDDYASSPARHSSAV